MEKATAEVLETSKTVEEATVSAPVETTVAAEAPKAEVKPVEKPVEAKAPAKKVDPVDKLANVVTDNTTFETSKKFGNTTYKAYIDFVAEKIEKYKDHDGTEKQTDRLFPTPVFTGSMPKAVMPETLVAGNLTIKFVKRMYIASSREGQKHASRPYLVYNDIAGMDTDALMALAEAEIEKKYDHDMEAYHAHSSKFDS
jgi:hypothetical protein